MAVIAPAPPAAPPAVPTVGPTAVAAAPIGARASAKAARGARFGVMFAGDGNPPANDPGKTVPDDPAPRVAAAKKRAARPQPPGLPGAGTAADPAPAKPVAEDAGDTPARPEQPATAADPAPLPIPVAPPPRIAATDAALPASPAAMTIVTNGAPPGPPREGQGDIAPAPSAPAAKPGEAPMPPVRGLAPPPAPTVPVALPPLAFGTEALLAHRGATSAATAATIDLAVATPTDTSPPTAAVSGAITTVAAPAAAAPDAAGLALDLRQHGWPGRMIDHIEMLRDAADATATTIRVTPDALGPIAVSVRRDGDVTHVHLAAKQAQTRTLLVDAQPRLAALAAERGITLGRTQIDDGGGAGGGGAGGDAGAGDRQRPAPPPDRAASTVPRADIKIRTTTRSGHRIA